MRTIERFAAGLAHGHLFVSLLACLVLGGCDATTVSPVGDGTITIRPPSSPFPRVRIEMPELPIEPAVRRAYRLEAVPAHPYELQMRLALPSPAKEVRESVYKLREELEAAGASVRVGVVAADGGSTSRGESVVEFSRLNLAVLGDDFVLSTRSMKPMELSGSFELEIELRSNSGVPYSVAAGLVPELVWGGPR